MGLEATLILVDNSDYARNGDFYPTRWEAQEEAANIVAQAKCQENAESAVGLMTMAGKQAEVLVTPIQDPGRILTAFHGVKLGGGIHLTTALQIAQLSLKHRLNKNQKQRVVVFIASPVVEDERTLENLGKKLKKNAVAVDIVNLELANPEQNQKLQKFVDAVNSSDNSHYVEAAGGMQMLSDFLISTPVLSGGEGGAMGGLGNEFGGSMDPELEMAIRISLEEEKERTRRQEEEKKKAEGKIEEEKPAAAVDNQMKIETENKEQVDEMDEEELMRRAQELSLQDPSQAQGGNQGKDEVFQDPSFVNELLTSIHGIDPTSEEIQKALEQVQKKEKDEKKDEKK